MNERRAPNPSMLLPDEILTERSRLRRWLPEDREPFAALNADPRVMEYFPALLNRDESDRLVQRIEHHFEQHGFGLWALEESNSSAFTGFVGLMIPSFEAPFMPCVEIGWRLAAEYWGRGYAPEAARVLTFGFEQLGLTEVMPFVALGRRDRSGDTKSASAGSRPRIESTSGSLPGARSRATRSALARTRWSGKSAVWTGHSPACP
jgi:RimJ/RimL family protein N-acetyltransferase